MTFQKLLCPVDFSACSDGALRTAVRLASKTNAELVLMHAWFLPATLIGAEYTVSPHMVQELASDAEARLAAAAREAETQGAKRLQVKLVNGPAWHAIVEAASDPAIDLVVLGTHGRTGVSRFLLGSVAEKVIRHAPCSVLAIRPDGELETIKHILCPIDFSDSSRHAIELAAQISRESDAPITLMHSVEIPVVYSGEPALPGFAEELDKHSFALLEKWRSELQARVGAPVRIRSRIGRPGHETLAVIDDDRTIDLVVMGSHGRTGIKRALLGSVAEKVVRHARCPVLVARKRT